MDTYLLRSFQGQVEFQCRAVVAAAQELDDALATMGQGDALGTVTAAYIAIQNLLTAAANLSKALWGSGGKHAAEREPLRRSINVGDDSPLRHVLMRNHFEHFDERLDKWWRESEHHNQVDMNLGRVVFRDAAEIDTFRNFDPSTGELTFWGEPFNTRAIVAEARRILPIVSTEAAKPHWETPPSPGGGGQQQRPS
jgi:hypothetical protein